MQQSIVCFFILLISSTSLANSNSLFSEEKFGKNSAVLVVDSQGQNRFAWNADEPLIPASTIKIVTAVATMERFGFDYRFKTDVLFKNDTLWIKGYGDPYLTSEELDVFAQNLMQKIQLKLINIKRIIVDGTHFPVLKVPGREATSQPYDAPLAAVSANFNTINVLKIGNEVTSAEPQTPITPLAKALGANLSEGAHRINLVKTENSEQYFAELLAEKLKQAGLNSLVETKTGFTPLDAELIYQHINSKTVAEVVHAMMFYSNNFIANQLYLQIRGPNDPVSFENSSAYILNVLKDILIDSGNGNIVEGSGLSRENRLTAEQLLQLLIRFREHKTLMKSYLDGKVFAKSGTLEGVQNLAGYISKAGEEYYFVFLFNDAVPWQYRNTLLERLYATL